MADLDSRTPPLAVRVAVGVAVVAALVRLLPLLLATTILVTVGGLSVIGVAHAIQLEPASGGDLFVGASLGIALLTILLAGRITRSVLWIGTPRDARINDWKIESPFLSVFAAPTWKVAASLGLVTTLALIVRPGGTVTTALGVCSLGFFGVWLPWFLVGVVVRGARALWNWGSHGYFAPVLVMAASLAVLARAPDVRLPRSSQFEQLYEPFEREFARALREEEQKDLRRSRESELRKQETEIFVALLEAAIAIENERLGSAALEHNAPQAAARKEPLALSSDSGGPDDSDVGLLTLPKHRTRFDKCIDTLYRGDRGRPLRRARARLQFAFRDLEADHEDILHDAIIKVCLKYSERHYHGDISGVFHTAVNNAAIDRTRWSGFRNCPIDAMPGVCFVDERPVGTVLFPRERDLVRKLWCHLRDEEREAMQARIALGETYKAVGARLGIDPKRAKDLVNNARRSLIRGWKRHQCEKSP